MRLVTGEALVEAMVRLVEDGARVVVASAHFTPPAKVLAALSRAVARGGVTLVVPWVSGSHGEVAEVRTLVELGARACPLDVAAADLYLSDREALVGTLHVIGRPNACLHATALDDAAILSDLHRHVEALIAQGRTERPRAPDGSRASSEAHRGVRLWQVAPEGYCIRCRASVPANPDRPLCRDCYESWAEHGNDDFPEKYCLACGAAERSSLRRPLCGDCYGRLYA